MFFRFEYLMEYVEFQMIKFHSLIVYTPIFYIFNSHIVLQGSRLGITTVISTDSIRHMMRSFVDEKQNPLLWASTYHAGEFLDPVAVAEAKAKRKAKKLAGTSHSLPNEEILDGSTTGVSDTQKLEVGSGTTELLSPKQMAIEGFKAQSEMVIDSLDRLITAWEERKESVVVEGVHLSLNFVVNKYLIVLFTFFNHYLHHSFSPPFF